MPTDEEPRSPGRTRSSTEDRERTVTILRAAAEAGFLTLEEADERMAACYQSQYRDQLPPLLADLPDHGRGLVPPDPADEAAAATARKQVRRGVGRHAAGVVLIGLVLTSIWAMTGGGIFWPAWPLFFLAMSVVFHLKHRARRHLWQHRAEHWAAHNGFPEHLDRHYWRHYGRGRGPWWDEERASRSW